MQPPEDRQLGFRTLPAPRLPGTVPLPDPQRHQILHQTTVLGTYRLRQTLDYVHSKGIMHRDIKPFNVLINPQRRQLKLIDFGLS